MKEKGFSPIPAVEARQEMADTAKIEAPKEKIETLPPELEDARKEVDAWFASNRDRISVFLEYKNANFNLQYNAGQGYYHMPKTDIISLDLADYKKYRDEGATVQQAIAFFFLHELSHLKAMLQEDTAGKMNMLEHFKYEQKKKIEDSEHPGKFLTLGKAYRQFYNILEDAIVNDMVLGTAMFGSNFGPASRQAGEELREMYVHKAFVLYRPTEPGQGDFAEQPDPENPEAMTMVKVGEGKGDWKIVDREDHKNGFDLTQCRPADSATSQFVYFFMKNQMLGLETERTAEQYDKEDKITVNRDVASVLNLPLPEAYEYLLNRVLEKYASDPDKLDRYLRFMGKMPQVVQHFKKNKYKTEKVSEETVNNVFDSSCIDKDTIRVGLAKQTFRTNLDKIGIKNADELSFIELFNKFKERKVSKEYSWTLPLRYNQEDRTTIMRKSLEPIYTLLSILDDHFDMSLGEPPQPPRKPEKPPKDNEDEPPERGVWTVGDEVRNNEKNSPYFGRKGVIREVIFAEQAAEGEEAIVASVRVDYYEDEGISKMAKDAKSLSGEYEIVENPDTNLILLSKKGKGGGKGSDERKTETEDDDEDEDENDEEENGEDNGEDNDENDQENKNNKDKKINKSGKKENRDQDIEDAMDELRKRLQAEIEADMQADEEAEKKEREGSSEGRKEKEKLANIERIQQALEQAEKAQDNTATIDSAENKALIEKMLELSEQLKPYADKMAKDWLEIIDNVAQQIEAVKDKYYRSGKVDMKKLQRFLPEIEAGMDYDNKMIYERIIERVMVELRPKMFRMTLLLDNSGSMSSNIDGIRLAVMLINSSLRNFRQLFKNKMEDILGGSNDSQNDIICDTEIMTFGERHNLVKPFEVGDLKFLDAKDAKYPEFNPDQEIINTLLAFKKIRANEGSTDDLASWAAIDQSHQDPEINRLLREKKMTEIVFQASDGQIEHDAEAQALISKLQNQGMETFGLAIGDENAFSSLQKRHGEGRVLKANTPEEIAENFGKIIKIAVHDKVVAVMEEALAGISAQA